MKPFKLARQIALFTAVYAVVVAMMTVVVPPFRQMFKAFDTTVPWITEFALGCSVVIANNLPFVAAVYPVTLVGYLLFRRFAPELRAEIDSSFGLEQEIITLFVLGVFVAAVLVAMYLPIFRITLIDS
jgi:type II secretory pathway component PulF